jgi:DNA-3-methyladenine glycosylase
LLGRVLEHLVDGVWLSVRIIETEAYYGQGQEDRASHASLGYTENRKALFMDPGTIYMYYSRGGDSLSFTCSGNSGNAVLVKSGYPVSTSNQTQNETMLQKMRQLNPLPNGKNGIRSIDRLCVYATDKLYFASLLDLKLKNGMVRNYLRNYFDLISRKKTRSLQQK